MVDGAEGDNFGLSASIRGVTAVFGALREEDDNGSYSGPAYRFNSATSQEIAKIGR